MYNRARRGRDDTFLFLSVKSFFLVVWEQVGVGSSRGDSNLRGRQRPPSSAMSIGASTCSSLQLTALGGSAACLMRVTQSEAARLVSNTAAGCSEHIGFSLYRSVC